jgi:hypothetical protein
MMIPASFQAFVLEQEYLKLTAVASGLEVLQVLDQCVFPICW